MGRAFAEKVVIITGASMGIGRELALQLAAQGARVVLAARSEEKLKQLEEKIAAEGGEAFSVVTDVGDKEQCQNLIQQAVERYGQIDALINNAGYGVTAPLAELEDIDLFDKQMQVNFNGSMYCTYYALPHLIKSKGTICGVSSIAGFASMAGSSIYNASKFAMRGFFDALRQEMKEHGVSVTMIYPGYVVTQFAANVKTRKGKTRGKKALGMYNKRMMTAETCARITIKAMAHRKREVIMTFSGNAGIWLKRFFPGLIDWIILKLKQKRQKDLKHLTGDEN